MMSVCAYSQGVEGLSKETRALLRTEMAAIDNGIKALFTAYYSGNFDEVARIAKEIEQSYILKNKLTKAQIHELHTKLPKGFLQLDEKFHYNAGMLAHVAKKKKPELVGFYYSELTSGCHSCHAEYAQGRFEFNPVKESAHHHH